MHVGLLIYGDLGTISGGYLYDRMLVQSLREAGHTVSVVSLPWRNYVRHLSDNLSAPLLRRLSGLNVDLLLQDELNHPSLAWLNRRLRHQTHYPIITIVHHLRCQETHANLLLPLYRKVERHYLSGLDGYIFNSQTTRAAVYELVGVRTGETLPGIVAYPAADHRRPPEGDGLLAERAVLCSSSEPLSILFVGNVIARKGLHRLLNALVRLPRSSWHLDVIGDLSFDPTYVRGIHQQIDRYDLHDSVRLAGSTSDQELRQYWAQSHLLAMPAFEGFGIVFLEAMSFGLPVIGSTSGAVHEIVSQGQDGFLVDLDDVSGLADQIALLQRDRERLLAMSIAARQRYERHPTWAQSMQAAVDWLEERVTGHG